MKVEQAKKIREVKGLEETKLQEIRVKRNMSQKDLSHAAGVSIRTIQKYERRERHIEGAKLETLCDLSKALDCKISDILDNEELIERFNKVK